MVKLKYMKMPNLTSQKNCGYEFVFFKHRDSDGTVDGK